MLSAIVAFSLRNRPLVLVATLLLVVLGLRAATQLPMDAVPDVTNVQVQIITPAPSLSPVEVEQYVTIPVERAMAGLPQLEEVRSISRYGLSVVTVAFRDGTDIYFARQLVNERMSEAREAVPERYGTPELGPMTTGLGEIFQFVVTNDRMSLMELQELLDWYIAPALRTVPGVVEVNSYGGENKEYQVVLDPARLQAVGLSIREVAEALEKANANSGGGYLEHAGEHFVIGTRGLVQSLEDLERVVVGATNEGTPITLDAIADVRFGPKLRRGAATRNGEGEVVLAAAMMLQGENARVVTDAIKERVEELRPTLPEGTEIEAFYDRSTLVDRTITTVGKNLLEGALLVVLVLFVLLGDLRAGLVVAATIPFSMLVAVLVMKSLGLSGNLMSLGAIDFGLVVDGAVIVVENAFRRLSEERRALGKPLSPEKRLAIVESATLEVRKATVFGEAIIAVVYLPVLALVGVEGKLFRPMALTVLFALGGAFVASLTLIPVLTSYFVQPRERHHDTWALRIAHRAYASILPRALHRPGVVVGIAALALVGTGALATRIGAEFVPQLDEGDLVIEARRLPGISLTESIATSLRLEREVLEIPEVEHIASRTGAPAIANDPMGLEASDVFVTLKPRSEWRKGLTKDDLAQEITEKLEIAVPEIGVGISQPIQIRTNELVAGIRSDLAAIVYGHDLDQMRHIADEIAEALRKVPGAVDVRVEQVAGLRYLHIVPDRQKLARHGLSIEDVNLVTETLAVGHQVGVVYEGERHFDLMVKSGHGFEGDIDSLKKLPLRSMTGKLVPLGEVARLELLQGPAQVQREGQSRRLIIELNVRDRDLMSVVSDAQAAVAKLSVPPGFRIEWGGNFRHYDEAKSRLAVVVPIALALIVFLLWMAFHSMKPALLIFTTVPFAVGGGLVALYLRDIPFSISAGVGFIALSGVAVLNGLVLVSFAKDRERHGLDPTAAIREAADLRLRPILMTALVASLGFLPMALSTAPGAEVQRPLATVVIAGIVSSTLATLLLLPAIYRRVAGEKPEQVQAEAA